MKRPASEQSSNLRKIGSSALGIRKLCLLLLQGISGSMELVRHVLVKLHLRSQFCNLAAQLIF